MEKPPTPGVVGESRRAMALIVLFGVVSLFSDMTYQGGRSLSGPYLGVLGADAAAVGLIAGLGEFLGYAARLLTGFATDRSRAYWLFALAGYAMLMAVPLIGASSAWQVVAIFIFLERLSKAVRAPAKDTILSMAARRVGTGFGFGLHKVMDQTGAIIGPLVLSAALSGFFGLAPGGPHRGIEAYQAVFRLLWIPFALTLLVVLLARARVPDPMRLEADIAPAPSGSGPGGPPGASERLSRTFWIYSAFTVLSGIGFVNFTLLSFHAKTQGILSDAGIPFWFAVAMALDGLAGFVAGRVYDKKGLGVLYAVPLLSVPIPFLGFLGTGAATLIPAVALWGFSLGIQETVIKAGIADLTSLAKRGTGYGLFNTINGVGLLGSGAIMGLLYEVSPLAICLFTLAAEAAGFAVLFALLRSVKPFRGAA